MTTADCPPFFSVVINTYNYGCYIEEAIDSVLSQTFHREQIEIIVVDDGSTDDTAERVRKYGDRISYIYKANGGQASAFNAGVAATCGEIIAFLDSDDYWAPSKLQEVAKEFSRSSSMDFVYHYMDVVDNDRHLLDRYVYPEPVKEHYLDAYLAGNLPWFSPTSGMAIRKDCLKKMMPLPEDFRIAADLHLHYLLPFYLRELSLIKKSLGYYRLHGDNLSGGNLLSSEKLKREQDIMLFTRDYVQRLAQDLGYDSHLLIKRLTAMVAISDICILSVEGHKRTAFKKALLFNTFLPADPFLKRLLHRLSLSIAVFISPSLNLWLQRKYRKIWYYLSR
ncbi:MAG: glycosyltransferase [Thermodesulfovibrionales bacterium]